MGSSIGKTQIPMLRNRTPTTGLEAKFSLEFALASAVVARSVGLGELTDGFVGRPKVHALFHNSPDLPSHRQRARRSTQDRSMLGGQTEI